MFVQMAATCLKQENRLWILINVMLVAYVVMSARRKPLRSVAKKCLIMKYLMKFWRTNLFMTL